MISNDWEEIIYGTPPPKKRAGKHNRNVEKVMIAAHTPTIEPSSLGESIPSMSKKKGFLFVAFVRSYRLKDDNLGLPPCIHYFIGHLQFHQHFRFQVR